MGIPWWIWILLGFSIINLIVPDPIPVVDEIIPFLIPLVFIINLLRKGALRNFYQQQYKQHQAGAGRTSQSSTGSSSQQGSGSFYSRFSGWGQGFQQPQAGTTGKDPYEVLGVKRGASMDEIKKAYRVKLKKYHPDIVANLKLGQEYREMFEEKTREIHKAYEHLGGK